MIPGRGWSAAMLLQPGQTLSDKYKILESLGSGNWGEVYLAEEIRLGRKVAIKCLKKDLCQDKVVLSQFLEEASKAASLKHRNVVIIYTCEQENDDCYIVMEYGDRGTVAQLIKDNERIPVLQAVDLVIGVCQGLSAAHRKGLIHGDVRPSNVILCTDEESENAEAVVAKLSDFGFAQRTRLTRKSAKAGVPAPLGAWQYVSPERLQEDPIDGRTDLYSLGISLYEMLVREPPFPLRKDTGVDAVIHGHLKVNPEPPASKRLGICELLDQTVMRALQKQPADRYADAHEMLKALEEARDAQIAWERELKELYEQAMAHFESKEWPTAVEFFEQLVEYRAPYENVPTKLAEAKEQVRRAEAYQRAMAFVAQKEWQKAKAELEDILRSDPNYRDGEAKAWLVEVKKQIELASLYAEAMKKEKDEDWNAAVRLFSKILSIQPGYEDVPTRLNQAEERRRIKVLYKEAVGHLDAEEWDEAIRKLDEVVRLDPDYKDTASKLEWAKRQKELEPLYEQAVKHFEQKDWANAVALLKQVVEKDPEYKDAARKLHLARNQMSQEHPIQGKTGKEEEIMTRPPQSGGGSSASKILLWILGITIGALIPALLNSILKLDLGIWEQIVLIIMVLVVLVPLYFYFQSPSQENGGRK